MGWFKVHSDDLHKVAERDEIQRNPEQTGIKTRDVQLYIGSYSSDTNLGMLMCHDPTRIFISDEVITKTNASDAFLKAVDSLMSEKGFDPTERYCISVSVKTVKEPV